MIAAAVLALLLQEIDRTLPPPSAPVAADPWQGPVALGSTPAALGFSPERLERAAAAVEEAVAKGEIPGAVLLVGRHGGTALRLAFGLRAVEPAPEPMTPDTIFDLASLTKPVVTATLAMQLVEEGRLRLEDRVADRLPGFAPGGGDRARVTVEQLLLHRAGFVPDDPLDLYRGSPDAIFARKFERPLAHAPGARFVYSDVGFEVLARLLEHVAGKPLDALARERVLEPLGMRDSGFRRTGAASPIPIARIAPTERAEGTMLRGVVHDPRARALGGVAGHAGLFGTADDLSLYCAAMLAGGGPILAPPSVHEMTCARDFGDGDLRALGWDVATAYSGPRGERFPLGSFGHTGFTGTSMWLDPVTKTWVVLLACALHPDGKGKVLALRKRVGTLVAEAIDDVPAGVLEAASAPVRALLDRAKDAAPRPDVRAGVDVLEAEGFRAVAGMRVALLTNPTGRARDGRSTIDVLGSPAAKAAGVVLVRLFAPEHGIRAALDEPVPDAVDERTGLAILSLYGEKKRPAPEDLAGLDAVVVDLQDAGCRAYTYLATMAYVLEEAAKARVAVVVLDRPNPLGGERFEGPVADEAAHAFTSYHRMPVRTGMTIGECARLYSAERGLGVDLRVVPLRGWRRSMLFDETGLPWIPPSPNLRTTAQAALYPGIVLLEFTNVSVGRGTETPFEVVGAPWIDGAALAARLRARAIPGVAFLAERFTPSASAHAGVECGGVRLFVSDRRALEPVRLGIEIACALRDLHPETWDRSRFGLLLAHAATLRRFEEGATPEALVAGWSEELAAWAERRRRFLLAEK